MDQPHRQKKPKTGPASAKETLFSVLENLPVAVLITRFDGSVAYTNPRFDEQFGLEIKKEGKGIVEFYDNPEERQELIKSIRENGFVQDYELRVHGADNRPIWVSVSARLLAHEGETVIVSWINNITKHKQTEESLARQVERLRALHTIDQAVISSLDLRKILRLLVQQITDQLGLDAASVLLFDPQQQRLNFAARQGFRTNALKYTSLEVGAGLAGRAARERGVVYIPDLSALEGNPALSSSIAREGFVAYFGVPLIAKGQLFGVLEIFHRSALPSDPAWQFYLETLAGQAAISIDNARLMEITQNHLKETEALYQINQRMAASIDTAQLMQDAVELLKQNFGYFHVQIFVRDPETGDFILRAASGAIGKKMLAQGYRLAPGEGVIGYTAETGTAFFTNDVDNLISFKRHPLLPETQSELAIPIRTGKQFLGLLDIHQAPPGALSKRDVQLVSTVADQLAVALQKAQLYADLQNSLRQEQSTRARLVHSEKLAVAGRLLASVSHELNNPLQAIQNALYLLNEEKGLSEQGQQDLKIVLSEAERMTAMLQRLRSTYQPMREEDLLPVDLNALIEDVHALVATHLRHAQISVELHLEPDLPPVPGMVDQLRQVLLNLFMNASDAMETGGRLSVSTRYLAESNEALVSIHDTGTGIDPALLPHIFEPFTTNKENGTGLGLSISYEIIFNHGGRIQAENNPGGGATFHVWLPASNGWRQ
jgi:PAS domain S-box-containing protein